jgi:hypothetical protein
MGSSYLAWAIYCLLLKIGLLSDDEINSLCDFDLPLLLSLPNRHLERGSLPFMRFNCEPIRYRHKSLLFSTVIHSANFMLQKQLEKKAMFTFLHKTLEQIYHTGIASHRRQS